VLQRALDDSSLAAHFKLDPETVSAKLTESHTRLFAARALRIRPGTDDKVLTAWNGLMLAAFAEAARVLDKPEYLDVATRNARFILANLRPAGQLKRAWRNGKTTDDVFLEDYAALILGLLELYQSDFDPRWFETARELADEMLERFSDSTGGFFDTPHDGETLLVRPKDVQDNATPAGNSLACEALLKLAAYTDEGKYRDSAETSLTLITDFALRHPLGFARWLCAAENAQGHSKQVAVIAESNDQNFKSMIDAIRTDYRPAVVTAAATLPLKENAPALLQNRPAMNSKTTAYVCEGFVCKQPTTEIETLIAQLNN